MVAYGIGGIQFPLDRFLNGIRIKQNEDFTMRIFKLILCTIIFSAPTFAQFTSASLFPEMKAINPAVIGQRSIGIFSAGIARENYEKTQDLSTGSFGAGASGKSDIEISDSRLFYGGKKGGFLTSEVFITVGSGEKKDTV